MVSPWSVSRPRRVLIVKPSSLGDIVTALPVLRGLRRTFPEAHIAWLLSTPFAPMIEGDGDLDEIIPFERKALGRAWRSSRGMAKLATLLRTLRRGEFDWTIDLQGLTRSALLGQVTGAPVRAGFANAPEALASRFYTHRLKPVSVHTADRNIELARALGVDARPEDMSLTLSEAGRRFAEAFCRDRNIPARGFVICVPPTRGKPKLYPVRHWRKVVSALAASTSVVLLGAPSERELCGQVAKGLSPRVIDLSGQTTLPEMIGIIDASAGVICSESAAKFIAAALGVGAITLIGPNRSDMTGPYLSGRAITADVPCQGCLRHKSGCRHATCMELIDPNEVIRAGRAMLAATARGDT